MSSIIRMAGKATHWVSMVLALASAGVTCGCGTARHVRPRCCPTPCIARGVDHDAQAAVGSSNSSIVNRVERSDQTRRKTRASEFEPTIERAEERQAPASTPRKTMRVRSIPSDVESAVPSPSDADAAMREDTLPFYFR